jgi:hypothetical protein
LYIQVKLIVSTNTGFYHAAQSCVSREMRQSSTTEKN